MEKPVNKISDSTLHRIIKIIDSASSAVCLLFALRAMTLIDADSSFETNWFVVYVMLALSKVMQAIIAAGDKQARIKNLCFAAAFVSVCFLPFYPGLTLTVAVIMIAVYDIVVLINRVFSIINNHRLRNVLLNGVLIIVLALVLFELFFSDETTLANMFAFHILFIAGAALAHIMKISFSQMRFNVLQKIIRKTFAAEILFGLVLLIISFSFIFSALEPGINSYQDALWYCFAVVTTIGFGDFTVTALATRALSAILGIYGIVVVALITSVIVNFYNEIKDSNDGDPVEKKAVPGPEKPEDNSSEQ